MHPVPETPIAKLLPDQHLGEGSQRLAGLFHLFHKDFPAPLWDSVSVVVKQRSGAVWELREDSLPGLQGSQSIGVLATREWGASWDWTTHNGQQTHCFHTRLFPYHLVVPYQLVIPYP